MSISFIDGNCKIRFSGVTDVGRVRDHNEDNFLVAEDMPLAAVSDGMGGHASGEVASQITVDTLRRYYTDTHETGADTWPFPMPSLHVERDRMAVSIKLANTIIHDTGKRDPSKKGMGCTADAIYFSQGRFFIGHVGDSRVYRIRGSQIQLLTEDHSLLNDYKRMKAMSGEETENFPHKNVVVRALGLAADVFFDILVEEYQQGDLYLLCSDGLTDMLDDATILATITRFQSIDTASQTLVQQANEAGGVDNITALVVRVEPV
ncbi:MAG: protein phosphatase 2C domain-containing protein [Nannocystaceae bacterium]|nr:protein phosphatase 2C domain-containing protein [Nannocystaceae bacterium]